MIANVGGNRLSSVTVKNIKHLPEIFCLLDQILEHAAHQVLPVSKTCKSVHEINTLY